MRVGIRDVFFLAAVLAGTMITGAGLLRTAGPSPAQPSMSPSARSELRAIVEQVDASFRDRWAEQKLVPAALAPELAVMRRLSLALCGSIPSLEEVRRFEARPTDGRIDAWLDDLLGDRRCADYLAERFARAYRRHRGRAVPPVPPPPLRRLAQRRDSWRTAPTTRLVTRPDRRPRASGPITRRPISSP